MDTAVACTIILGILLFGLGLWTSFLRLVRNDFYSGNASPESFVTKVSRAHGNTAEFAPFIALLIWFQNVDASVALQAFAWGATVSRVLVVAGFLTSQTLARMSLLKALGAIGTYGFGLALTFSLIVKT
jgi:uncharacterized protein